MLPLSKVLFTIAPFIISAALAEILPNLTYPTPTPSLACYSPQVTRSIWYNDCREALEMFRSQHQGRPVYTLTHITDPPGEAWFLFCPYKLRLGTCMLSLDYKDQWEEYYPLVEIDFIVHFGNRLARRCVRDSRGAGGTAHPLDAAGLGSAVLKLQYS